MVEVLRGVTRSGMPWVLRDGECFYLEDGRERPWPPYWNKPRTSFEPTDAERRQQDERERRHRGVPAKVARLRQVAERLRRKS